MQKDEASAIWRKEQMVEPVFRIVAEMAAWTFVRDRGCLGDAEDEFVLACLHIHLPDAHVIGCQYITVWIGHSAVAIAGAGIVESPKVSRYAPFTVGTKGINGPWEDPLFARFNVQ